MPAFTPPKNLLADINHKTISSTTVCHISVGKWMNEEGVEFLSGERAERCARVAADIAAETVNMLNAWKQGHGALSSLSGELYRLQGNQYNLTP